VVSHLNAVWVDASGTAFVVGEDMAVLRSDGSGWSPLSLGTVMGGFLSVWGASTDNVYMVGFGNTAFVWNGTGFKSILIQPNAYHNFHGVFGTGPDDVYVATEVISPPPPGPAHAGGNIFRWDGDAWTPVFAEPVHDVLSVWRHGRQGFATGDSSSLLRDSGTGTWSRVLDVENLPYYVNSVHGSSLSNVLIVGNDGAIIRYGP
jgi:photosystem II stability/assembly factor-like uncharacterized protein